MTNAECAETLIDTLFQAAASGNDDVLKPLLAGDPSLANVMNPQGVSLLLWAMYHRQTATAKLIYRHIAYPSAEQAIAVDDVEALQAALKADPALIAQYSSDGFTLLHYACFFANKDCVQCLLNNNAEVNCAALNTSKVYPIHSAAAAQSIHIAALLLEAGANPNVQQAGGFTPLMGAASHNNVELVKLLLSYRADKSIRDDSGKTAYDHGVEKGFILEMLKLHD